MKCLFLVVLLLLISSCNNKKEIIQTQNISHDNYSLLFYKHDVEKKKFNNLILHSENMFSVDKDSNYIYGNFRSPKSAWFFAEMLIRDTIIYKYKLLDSLKYFSTDFNNLIFLSDYLGRPSLYKFNFRTLKKEMVWSAWGRKILHLYPYDNDNQFYFTTGLTLGRSGGFPYITEARLYKYDKLKNSVDRINIFGNGLHMNARWKKSNRFEVSFITLDSLKSNEFIKRKYSFDNLGRAIDTIETRYNILTDGFPKREPDTIEFNSPDRKFLVQARPEGERFIISIFKNRKDFLGIVDTTLSNISKIVWQPEGKYVAIKTLQSNSFGGASLYVINLSDFKIIKRYNVFANSEMIFYGDYLLFENIDDDLKYIELYDCFNEEEFYKIKLSKNTGIFTIPIKYSSGKFENIF